MRTQDSFMDKACVVTGAASGIGLAVSQALLEAGAAVVMADRDANLLASAVASLGRQADRAQTAIVDVTRQEQVAHCVQDTAARLGRLDFLFNNAGIGGTMPIEQATLDHWRRLIDINLWGVIYGIDAALPIMRRQGSGHIVNTASIAGLVPIPFQALYCATKFAVSGLSESLRFELEDEGIHVSVVCPGNVASRIFGTSVTGEYRDTAPPQDAISTAQAAQIILDGVARQQGIIAFPEQYRQLWRGYWSSPEAAESELQKIARDRRNAYRTKGNYY